MTRALTNCSLKMEISTHLAVLCLLHPHPTLHLVTVSASRQSLVEPVLIFNTATP